jgi:membrane protein
MALEADWHILRQAARQWSADHASEMGAALAYFTLFSIAPLLIIAIGIAGLVFGPEAAQGAVEGQLTQIVGPDAAHAIQGMLKRINRPTAGFWATVAGSVTIVLGALGAFLHLRSALCRIWHLEPSGGGGILATILNYVLAIVMVLCCGGLLLVSMTASTALAFLGNRYAGRIPGGQGLWQTLEFIVSVGFMTLLFAVAFRVLSARRIPWGLIWYGAAVTSLLFTIGKTLIGYYLAYFAAPQPSADQGSAAGAVSPFGAAGSLVVFLIWVYYSSQIVFFGAELIQVRRTQAGQR